MPRQLLGCSRAFSSPPEGDRHHTGARGSGLHDDKGQVLLRVPTGPGAHPAMVTVANLVKFTRGARTTTPSPTPSSSSGATSEFAIVNRKIDNTMCSPI